MLGWAVANSSVAAQNILTIQGDLYIYLFGTYAQKKNSESRLEPLAGQCTIKQERKHHTACSIYL